MPSRRRTSTGLAFALLAVVGTVLPSREADGGGGGCPAGMALIEPAATTAAGAPASERYCIDRYEASLVEITPRGERRFSPYEMVKDHKVRAVSRAGVVPQAYISRNEALAACQASGKRLCSEGEWRVACQGKRPTTYPYGDEHREGYCNDHGVAPLQALYADLGEGALAFEPMNDPRLNQLPRTIARTGAHPHCKNSYGVFDMVGNLHEWIDDPNGTFRGGYYLDTHINGDGCRYRTVAHDAAYHDYSTGFRCCATPR